MRFLSLRSEDGSRLVPYAKAWEFQKHLVEKRVRDEIPDSFLFVEHPSTVTRGRGLQRTPERDRESERSGVPSARGMPLGPLSPGTEYFEIERGGDLTWHGPGQLVIYPIVKLDGSGFGPNHDVTGFLRKLERTLAAWLEVYGLSTVSRENATGIWVHARVSEGAQSEKEDAKKIASIGIAVRKWVTYHGIGLNITNSLEGYREISPCGFSPEVMTTLSSLLRKGGEREGQEISWSDEGRAAIERELARAFAALPSGDEVSVRIERI